jgi:hypothetical protein
VKRITADGLVELADDVPIGVERTVDLDSVREVRMWNTEWLTGHNKVVIDVIDVHAPGCGCRRWFPCELLKITPRH